MLKTATSQPLGNLAGGKWERYVEVTGLVGSHDNVITCGSCGIEAVVQRPGACRITESRQEARRVVRYSSV